MPGPGADPTTTAGSISLANTLAQLEALPAPDGADPQVFAELKTQLAESLKATGHDRFSAAVPDSERSAVNDLALAQEAEPDAVFTFTYSNYGDYNQDSLVSVSDITPLGVNWGKKCLTFPLGGFESDSLLAVVDGNGNGLIEVGDITPIGQNYQCAVEGYVLQGADTASPGGDWQEVKRVPFGDSNVVQAGERRTFSVGLASPVDGEYYRVVPYSGNEIGIASNVVQYLLPVPEIEGVEPSAGRTGAQVKFTAAIGGAAPTAYNWDFGGGADPNTSADAEPIVQLGDAGVYQASLIVSGDSGSDDYAFDLVVNANLPPVASLTTATPSGNVPLQVVLNASESSDSDGEITSYEWDYDGDGTWDDQTTEPLCSHIYSEAGTFDATVRVHDDNDATDTASVTIEAGMLGGSWNFLVWIAADNNLAQAGVDDINEMEEIGSTQDVTILVGYDIDPTWLDYGVSGVDTVNFIKVVQDTDTYSINTTGDPNNRSFPRTGYNSADPANIAEFLDWADAYHPAAHSALILWDHGSGWLVGEGDQLQPGGGAGAGAKLKRRQEHRRGTSGILADDTDGTTGWDLTANSAVIAALAGRHFDIIGFDACNMGDVESIYDYSSLADWVVASQELVPFDGYAYKEVLADWNAQLPSAKDISGIIADDYVSKYQTEGEYVQMVVYRSSKVDALAGAMGELAGLVEANAEQESDAMKQSLYDAYDLWAGGVRDLGGFVESYQGRTSNSSIQQAGAAVMDALGEVVVHVAEYQVPDAQGVSAFLPDEYYFEDYLFDDYSTLPFNLATNWLGMIEATLAPPPPMERSWSPGDKVLVSWSDQAADVDIGITDPFGNHGWPWWPDDVQDSIQFSLDSYETGEFEEWAKLKPAADHGGFKLDVEWIFYDEWDPPATISVSIKLLDSGDNLKEDLGLFPLSQWTSWTALVLNY